MNQLTLSFIEDLLLGQLGNKYDDVKLSEFSFDEPVQEKPYEKPSELTFLEAVKKGRAEFPDVEHIGGTYFEQFEEDGTLGCCMVGFALLGAGVEPSSVSSEREKATALFPELQGICSTSATLFTERIDEIINWNDRATTNNLQTLISRYETRFKEEDGRYGNGENPLRERLEATAREPSSLFFPFPGKRQQMR